MPEKLIFRNITSVSKLYMAYRSTKSTCTFPHKYTQLRSLVLVLWETYNIFLFFTFSQKTDNVSWQSIKNKGYLTVNTFPNYAYVSSYFSFQKFCMKTRLDNISKMTQGETLGRTIFESPYWLLQVSLIGVNWKQPNFCLTALEF